MSHQLYQYLAVLDFEATCLEGQLMQPQEVIEFPTVLVDTATLTVVDEFHEYVRPTVHPTLSPFCTTLTGIQQSTVDISSAFPEVFARYLRWLEGVLAKGSVLFVTCGDWDLKTMLPTQCHNLGLSVPPVFATWCNIKRQFEGAFPKHRMHSMPQMLTDLGLPLIGHHHNGLDDSRNIAAAARELMRRGAVFDATNDKKLPKKGKGLPFMVNVHAKVKR